MGNANKTMYPRKEKNYLERTKTPPRDTRSQHDNDLLRSNGIYMAGTDNRMSDRLLHMLDEAGI